MGSLTLIAHAASSGSRDPFRRRTEKFNHAYKSTINITVRHSHAHVVNQIETALGRASIRRQRSPPLPAISAYFAYASRDRPQPVDGVGSFIAKIRDRRSPFAIGRRRALIGASLMTSNGDQ
ncbi:hypothetical protein EVAR_27856_1 [Eumeta japonica]|uniref:Uncharacterized protein n=1 Tax=Eumeta variegata TaxID=151549 RepID=A0A4C1VJA5_EUMVA|nr:hypothetical protein EVAR_27856_1 [Eumeta japonica]